MRLYLDNDFHNSETFVLAKQWNTIDDSFKVSVPKRSWNDACRRLCGMRDCECGDIRGNITDRDGNKYIVTDYDNDFVYLDREI